MKDRHNSLCCGRNKEAYIPAADVQNEKKKMTESLTFRNEIFFFTQTAALQWIWMGAASVVFLGLDLKHRKLEKLARHSQTRPFKHRALLVLWNKSLISNSWRRRTLSLSAAAGIRKE